MELKNGEGSRLSPFFDFKDQFPYAFRLMQAVEQEFLSSALF